MHALLTDAPQVAANELVMAKNMADLLHRHYPGHLWAVNVDGGMANVRNLALSGQWGFRIKVPLIYSASQFDRKVVMAGGELLERYRVRRGAATEAMNHLLTDAAGRPKADHG